MELWTRGAKSFGLQSEETHPMHDVVVMQESHTLQQHDHVTFDLGWGQGAVSVPYHLREVRHHEVKDQHKAGAVGENALELHHLQRKRTTVATARLRQEPSAPRHRHARCPQSLAGL